MIVKSVRQTAALRADLLAATAALAQITASSPRFDQFSSINKAALGCIYLLSPRHNTQHTINPGGYPSYRAAPRAKSP